MLPLASAVVGVAVLAYLLRPYATEIRDAAQDTSLGTLALLAGLSLLALALRTEMWRVALRAASGQTLPRRELHCANGGTFLVSLVNGYVAPIVKIWLLRRMRGRDARIAQLVVVDFAAGFLEILVAAGLIIVAAFAVDLPWWIPTVLTVGALAVLLAMVLTHRRWEHHPAVQGLNVVMHSYHRYRLLVLLAGVFGFQILRTWIALDAVGLDASLGAATLIFVLTGALGALPTGLAAAPTTSSVLVLGRDSVGAAAASGVLVTVALFAATILYTVATAGWYLLHRRATPRPAAVAPPDSSRPRPASGP